MIEQTVSNALKDVKHAVDGATQAVEQSRRIYGSRLLFRGVLWVLVYILSIWLLTDSTVLGVESRAARVAVALIPTPFFGWWLWGWMKGLLHMDELQRRIELEALAFAFPTALLFLAVLGLIDTAIPLTTTSDFNLRHAWLMMPMLYYTGLWRAQSRYA